MAFDQVAANAGSGGENFAFDQFTDTDGNPKTMAYTAIAFGPLNGPYIQITTDTPLPAQPPLSSGKITHTTDSPLSADSEATLDSAQISVGKTGNLLGIVVWSSAPLKITLQSLANGVATTKLVAGSPAGVSWDWKSPHKQLITAVYSATAGLDGFRLLLRNLDPNLDDATVYGTFLYDEVDT